MTDSSKQKEHKSQIGKTGPDCSASGFEVITSGEHVFERLAEMFSSERCKNEVLFCGTEKCAGRLLVYLRDLIVKVPKRKVDFRVLIPVTKQNLEDIKTLSKFVNIKHSEQIRDRIVIVDRKEILLIYNASDTDDYSNVSGLWLNNKQFSEMQALMFEAEWKRAVDLKSKVKEIEARTYFDGIIPPVEVGVEENTSVVFTLDPEGKITYLSHNIDPYLHNAISVYINGLNKDKITEFSYPEDQEKIHRIWQMGNKGIPGKDEFRTIQASGEIRWWSASWLPLIGKKGGTEVIRVVLKDITVNKKLEAAEKELIHNEILLFRSQEIAHVGSWELDLLTDELELSEEAYLILGLNPLKKIDKFQALLEKIAPQNLSVIQKSFLFWKNTESEFDFKEKFVKADGKVRVLRLKGEIIRDHSGRAIKSTGIIHDITN